jgi:O-acetyl-ADP-ribose deacetylase (regulator of RNase III)
MAEYLEVDGDLFDPSWGFEAVGHGTNGVGVMGAGIAKTVKRLYPDAMFTEYQRYCIKHGSNSLGTVHEYIPTGDLPILFNLFTQYLPGPNADYGAVAMSVFGALETCKKLGVTILGLPKIGTGIGGLTWEFVQRILKTLVSDTEIGITVVRYQNV